MIIAVIHYALLPLLIADVSTGMPTSTPFVFESRAIGRPRWSVVASPLFVLLPLVLVFLLLWLLEVDVAVDTESACPSILNNDA